MEWHGFGSRLGTGSGTQNEVRCLCRSSKFSHIPIWDRVQVHHGSVPNLFHPHASAEDKAPLTWDKMYEKHYKKY